MNNNLVKTAETQSLDMFKVAANDALADKIIDALEAMKADVSQKFFGTDRQQG